MANSTGRSDDKAYQPRDARIVANPSDRNYVRFAGQGLLLGSHSASFGDVSTTGMRLISRQPNRAKIGDVVDLQFSLPGSRHNLKSRALVIRKVSEFEFAVAFMDFASSRRQVQLINAAIQDYVSYLRATPFAKQVAQTFNWMNEHRRGLAVAAFGLVLFASAFSWIYRSSDEFNGREIKAWGKQYPKQYDWDYYNKIPKSK